MEQIGLLLFLAGILGLLLSIRKVGRRKRPHTLPPTFDFGHYKRFENNR